MFKTAGGAGEWCGVSGVIAGGGDGDVCSRVSRGGACSFEQIYRGRHR